MGEGVDIDDLPAELDASSLTDLFVDRSPPLSEVIDVCLKWSRNEYAETLLHAVAQPAKPATAVVGLDVMRTQLQSWGIAPRCSRRATGRDSRDRTTWRPTR